MGVCNCSMFCCALLYVHSSIAIILMGKRELVALLNLSSWCLVMVERLFLAVPRGCLQFVIVVFPDHTHLSPYLTGLRLFCDSWRQTSRVGRKAVSKQSPVIRNFLACVAKWRKVVAKILNMFKNFMRQNSSQNGRKVIASVSNPSRTCRQPLAI